MKHTIQLILFLTVFVFFFLPACGGQRPAEVTTESNADHLVKFDENGIAVLRGQISGGGFSANTSGKTREAIQIFIPVKVEGIKTRITIPFLIRPESEFSSSMTSQTMTVREYNIYHPFDQVTDAFPRNAWAEITFRKNGAEFEAISFHEVIRKFSFFQTRSSIDGVFSTDPFSQGTVSGCFRYSSLPPGSRKPDYWMLEVPVDIHGVKAIINLEIRSAPHTRVITSNGVVALDSGFSWGNSVLIQFTRKGNRLIADQITVFH